MSKHVGIMNKVNYVNGVWISDIRPVELEYETAQERRNEFYLWIGCDFFDVMYIEIAGKTYSMYFNEEGKLKTPWHPTYPLRYQSDEILDVIAGSVLVLKEDAEGNVLEFTPKERKAIEKHLYVEMMAARGKVDEILDERRRRCG